MARRHWALAALIAGMTASGLSGAPQVASGQLQMPGLSEPVEIIRDRWGVNHIYARNESDLFFAQGTPRRATGSSNSSCGAARPAARSPKSWGPVPSAATPARGFTSFAAISTPSSVTTIRAANRLSNRSCAA